MKCSEQANPQRQSRLVLARDCGEKRGLKVAVNKSGVSFWGNGNVPELDNGERNNLVNIL